jgi:hypothetical protein
MKPHDERRVSLFVSNEQHDGHTRGHGSSWPFHHLAFCNRLSGISSPIRDSVYCFQLHSLSLLLIFASMDSPSTPSSDFVPRHSCQMDI